MAWHSRQSTDKFAFCAEPAADLRHGRPGVRARFPAQVNCATRENGFRGQSLEKTTILGKRAVAMIAAMQQRRGRDRAAGQV
jgi:hypothetical protein